MSEKPKFSPRDVGYYLLIFVILIGVIGVLMTFNAAPETSYAEVRRYFLQEQVEYFELKDNVLTLRLKEALPNGSTTVTHTLANTDIFYADMGALITAQLKSGTLLNYNYPPGFQAPGWVSYLPTLLILALCGFVLYTLLRRQSNAGGDVHEGPERGGRFGQARTRKLSDTGPRVTFDDVAGAEEEKEELAEIVQFLKDPKKFLSLGAHIPKGVLLVGPPGTGKTLLARAVAGEAGVEFLSISGSDFVELYVGIGASRVRDLFEQAKADTPSIVFIDEIDAVGRQRGAGLGGGHDEREQTLNQLLVEMDGFSANEGVVILAATNRPDILDPALLRPGRFDRQVYVGLPDIKGREEILRVHARNKPLAEDVDLSELARGTAGFTGADLENLLNEGALLAGRGSARYISKDYLDKALIKVIAGPEKKSRVVTEHARRLTAYHEAGHAIVSHALDTADPVHMVTIVPRGRAGGMTISLPQEDKYGFSRREMEQEIAICLGGRVAEELVLGDSSTGASSDLVRATKVAREMVAKYGMSDALGNLVFETGGDEVFIGRTMAHARTYSEEVAAKIDAEMRVIIDRARAACHDILTARRAALDGIAAYLLEHETMDGETFRAMMEQY